MKRDETSGNGTQAIPDIVRRAAAILAQQAPVRSAFAPMGAAGPDGRPAMPPPPVPSMEEMRERAMKLVSDFFDSFASLGPLSELSSAVQSAIAAAASPASGGTLPAGPTGLGGLGSGLATLLWQSAPGSTRAGESVKMPLQAENRQNRPVQAGYYSSDLLSDSGRTIPGYQVSFDPPSFTLRPGERTPVTAKIEVPLQTVPGAYSGLVQAAGLPESKAVITIDVI